MRRRQGDFRRSARRKWPNVVWWTLCGTVVLLFIVIFSKESQIESRPASRKNYFRHDRIPEGLNITDEMLSSSSVTRQLSDQISVAKAFVVIAKESNNLQFAWELSAQIRNSQSLLSDAATRRVTLTTRESETAIRDMALLLYQAQQYHYDSATMIMRLKAKIQALEEQMSSMSDKSSKYGQIAAEEVPKGLYCLGIRLTTEWFANSNIQRKINGRAQTAAKLRDNSLFHFCIFSDNILATSVVVNSTAINSNDPSRVVFHLVTDEINYAAMRAWFAMNNFQGVTVEVQKFEDFKWLNASYVPVLKQLQDSETQNYYFSGHNDNGQTPIKFRNPKYLSMLNHLRFYIPEVFPALKKLVFLDDDVVVQKDLSALFSVDLNGNVNGAVETCMETFHRYHKYLNYSHLRFNTAASFKQVTKASQALLEDLKSQGIIGEDPIKQWSKNRIKCYLDIKNPDFIIEDRPLKHVTPLMEEQFRRHIASLLKLGVIRPSQSKHRTTAFMVNSGTTIDPITGLVHGKERMVFNYKRLNDLTNKDQYSLPGIQTILARVGRSKIYSKFDLKSGFHQVAMHEESIPWTAFWVPDGLYEWLVMPFGLKNAPAVFQRKMDNCFKGTEAFIAVYIDDILVFSENEEDHEKHLRKMLEICKDNGLVLSPTKMKIAQKEVEFLGAIIKEGRIRLQPNIIKKVVNFGTSTLGNTKGLRSFLSLLNYARAYIPNMGKLLSPLYAKISPTGERRMNTKDWKLIRQIQENIKPLPDLSLPPSDCSIIIETDRCMEGWGGVCKWKPKAHDPRRLEEICAYASGKFAAVKSTIDAEIHAVIRSLEAFKI